MNLTPVSFSFVTPKGDPVQNTTVEIQLAKAGFDDDITGVIMPRPILAVTDENGEVTVPLAASPTMYYATVEDKASEAVLSYKFLVPVLEIPGEVRFQDIVVEGTLPNTSYDEAALLVIHNAKANAMAAQVAAQAAAVQAVDAADSVEVFTGQAAASAGSAETAKIAAQTAGTSAANAKVAAETAKTAAETAATTASTAQTNAGISANSASASAAAALASKNAAAASEVAAEIAIPVWSDTPPLNPVENSQWVDSTTGRRYQWIVGTTSSAWVETGAVVAIGSDVAVQAQASAVASANSAAQAAATAAATGLTGAVVDGSFRLKVTRGDNTVFDAGYVRGERGEAFSVDEIGTNLAGRDAYDAQGDGFSYLDTGAGNLYFRQGVTAGVWSAAIPFGKGDKGDPGTPGPTDYTLITNRPALGTASVLNAPASGNAANAEVVKGNDTRLSDPRAPTAHVHLVSALSDATTIGKAVLVAANTAAAKSAIGIPNVENTADIDKPVSTAVATALAGKEPLTAGATAAHYRRGDKTWQLLDKTAVGLPAVLNAEQVRTLRPGANQIYIGWNASGKMDCRVDSTDFGINWPINITGSAAAASSCNGFTFLWNDDGSAPNYLVGGNSSNTKVFPPSRLSVGYANNAGQVNGVGGWNYGNRGYNPMFLWATEGNSQDQFLVQPGNLSVNWANTANSANYVNGRNVTYNNGGNVTSMRWDGGSILLGVDGNEFGGTAEMNVRWARNSSRSDTSGRADSTGYADNCGTANNANNFGGQPPSYYIIFSDERLKENIVPTTQDSLAKILQIDFKQYNFRLMEDGFQVDDGETHKLGPIAQQLQKVDPEWVRGFTPDGSTEWLTPNLYPMLMASMHAITQLEARIAVLEAKQ